LKGARRELTSTKPGATVTACDHKRFCLFVNFKLLRLRGENHAVRPKETQGNGSKTEWRVVPNSKRTRVFLAFRGRTLLTAHQTIGTLQVLVNPGNPLRNISRFRCKLHNARAQQPSTPLLRITTPASQNISNYADTYSLIHIKTNVASEYYPYLAHVKCRVQSCNGFLRAWESIRRMKCFARGQNLM
jgi:hypothetical protein